MEKFAANVGYLTLVCDADGYCSCVLDDERGNGSIIATMNLNGSIYKGVLLAHNEEK